MHILVPKKEHRRKDLEYKRVLGLEGWNNCQKSTGSYASTSQTVIPYGGAVMAVAWAGGGNAEGPLRMGGCGAFGIAYAEIGYSGPLSAQVYSQGSGGGAGVDIRLGQSHYASGLTLGGGGLGSYAYGNGGNAGGNYADDADEILKRLFWPNYPESGQALLGDKPYGYSCIVHGFSGNGDYPGTLTADGANEDGTGGEGYHKGGRSSGGSSVRFQTAMAFADNALRVHIESTNNAWEANTTNYAAGRWHPLFNPNQCGLGAYCGGNTTASGHTPVVWLFTT